MPDEGVIICPNHASYLDPLFVQLVIPRRVTFVMTNDFYRKPWGRWFFKLVDAIPVGGWRLSRAGMRRAVAHVKCGRSVVIFPEGRLSRNGKLGNAKRGIARVAGRSGATVYPVAILGSARAWPPGSSRPGVAKVRLKFGKPLRFDGNPDPDAQQAFADEVMRRIATEHAWLREHAPTALDARPAPTTA
jgi:1-acyl-sn-glycerol-3-phosphate acyltransferase